MATIRKKNAIKAWKEGCDDVKKVIETLFPDIDFHETTYKKGDIILIKATIVQIDGSDMPYAIHPVTCPAIEEDEPEEDEHVYWIHESAIMDNPE